MIDSPFALFRPFADRFHVAFMTKEDGISGDADIARLLRTDRLASLRQVHGNRTLLVREPMQRTHEADGMITDQTDLWLSVRTADCQPIIAYAPTKHVAGVLHAGWKGLLNGAIPGFFNRLNEEFGVKPADVFVAVGPSLCKRCAQFTDPRQELPGIDARFFNDRFADLPGIADDQIRKAGVPVSHIERSPDCTKCNADRYWSYRGGDREAVVNGRTNVLACAMQ